MQFILIFFLVTYKTLGWKNSTLSEKHTPPLEAESDWRKRKEGTPCSDLTYTSGTIWGNNCNQLYKKITSQKHNHNYFFSKKRSYKRLFIFKLKLICLCSNQSDDRNIMSYRVLHTGKSLCTRSIVYLFLFQLLSNCKFEFPLQKTSCVCCVVYNVVFLIIN